MYSRNKFNDASKVFISARCLTMRALQPARASLVSTGALTVKKKEEEKKEEGCQCWVLLATYGPICGHLREHAEII